MDRPRADRKNPSWLKFKRTALAGLAIFAIVMGVASLPVLVLSFWIQPAGGTASPSAPLDPPLPNPIRTEHFMIPSGDIELYSTFFRPPDPGPFPTLVLVHGSGRTLGMHMQQSARFFAERGIAALVFDKRGVGRSGGEYSGVGAANSHSVLTELAGDVKSAVFFLKQRPEVRRDRIGLLGFSQAGWIVPMAAQTADISLTVIVSGPTVSVGEEIFYSELTGDDAGQRSSLSAQEIRRSLALYEGPRGFDPVPYLEKMEKPGLWIFGEHDRSIPVPESITILDDLIASNRKHFQYRVLRGGDHGLRNSSTHRQIPFFPLIHKWLLDQGFSN